MERGKSKLTPSQQQRANFAYGNTKLSNPDVTREMCEDAVRKKDAEKSKLAEIVEREAETATLVSSIPGQRMYNYNRETIRAACHAVAKAAIAQALAIVQIEGDHCLAASSVDAARHHFTAALNSLTRVREALRELHGDLA